LDIGYDLAIYFTEINNPQIYNLQVVIKDNSASYEII